MSDDTINRLNTALEGRYRIEQGIGEGGMATVYLARDLKHNRNVALKVLKPELAAVVGAERFLAEIETTANLHHPHILPLFDSGEAESFLFYVMPFVEGETLRDRVDREKQLPVEEAVSIATSIAKALHHAHDRGVVHRDIKPANILMQEGQPVVSDFGIALAVGSAGGARLTETGLSVGTPYYMSPEQATGDQQLGPGSDIYALGAVLYELLTGDPPYQGSTAQAVLGKIIQGTPVSATQIRRTVPLNVDAAIRKALEKLPADRFTGALDFAKALADPGFRHGQAAGLDTAGEAGGRSRRTAAMGAIALVASALAVAGWMRPGAAPMPVARFESPFRDEQRPVGGIALAHDGSGIIYVGPGGSEDGSQLWLRQWDALDARPIPGSEGVRRARSVAQFALSPDGREVVFVEGSPGPVRVVPITGGPSRTLVESAYNATWSDDGWVYFTRSAGGIAISRVADAGGEVEVVSELAEGQQFHSFPHPLPGRSAILYQVWNTGDGSDAEIWALDLSTQENRLLTAGSNPTYAESGHLVFGSADGRLMAAPFDVTRLELTGPALPVVEGLFLDPTRGNVTYAVGRDGTLAYVSGEAPVGLYELVWVSRDGEVQPVHRGETFALSPEGNDGWRLSPSDDRVAFTRHVDGNDDVWIKTLPAGPVSRLTFSPEMDLLPQWMPDGVTVTYRNGGLGEGSLWSMRADGTGEPTLLETGDANPAQAVWSPDGSWLVLRSSGVAGNETARDIVAFRPEVDSVPTPLIATPGFWEQSPAISPDGRWLAYSSNETGRHEIFVRPFPDVSAGKWQVSTGGGINPLWAHGGGELFFLNPTTREFIAAGVTTLAGSFQTSGLTSLFELPSGMFWQLAGNNEPYDVASDDQRFLMARAYGSDEIAPTVVLVQNFFSELERIFDD